MREILFRGKRADNGEWVEGCLIYGVKQKKGKSYMLPENIDQPGCHHLDGFEVIPESVGQFTGLLDKNGKKIFESDILSCNGSNYRVEFMNGSWVVVPNRKTKGIEFLYYCLQDLEIIGNIHDNKELLK